MKKESLISIGILNYNGLKYLKKTIPPLLKINYLNYEIVVVDNNSSDKSIEYLKSLNNNKINIIKNKENYGCSKGKNICVENCRGAFILLLDEDILILNKNSLKNLIKYYKNFKKIGFLAPIFRDVEKRKTRYYGIFSSWYGLNIHKKPIDIKKINKKLIYQIGAHNGGIVFFKKEVWKKLRGYSELQKFTLNDFDLGFKSYLFGYENYLYPFEDFIHIGKEKDYNPKKFAWKYRYYFSGVSTMMFKNYKTSNLLLRFPLFLIFCLGLYFGLLIFKMNWRMPLSLFISIGIFLKNIKKITKERKKIQSTRIVKEDIFLKIKPQKFE